MRNNKIFYFLIFIIILLILFFTLTMFSDKEITPLSDQNFFLRVDRIRDIKIKNRHIETPKNVRAIYMSSWVGSNRKMRSVLINFINNSRINSVVLDIKDYSGLISFDIDNELIDRYSTDSSRISDIDNLIDELHDDNIYVIGRITVFQDPLLAKVRQDFAFNRKDNGLVWKDKKGLAFINPQIKEAWEYFAVIAEESYKKGFDEINFDYIRYPSDGDISNLDYALNGNTKLDVMKSFYNFLDKRLHNQDIPISVDLFGFTASREGGLTIGQNFSDALPHFDAVAPMVYPSHYPNNYLGFSNPAEHPYDIVYHEMNLAMKKVLKLGLPNTNIRTWIQDFNLGANYGFKEIHDQITASYNAGVLSYMVWDPNNRYTKSAYYDNLIISEHE